MKVLAPVCITNLLPITQMLKFLALQQDRISEPTLSRCNNLYIVSKKILKNLVD
jgi:hypothetical protein